MTTKVKEITSNPNGDRRSCAICTPRPDRVPHDRVWAWSLEHPGQQPLR